MRRFNPMRKAGRALAGTLFMLAFCACVHAQTRAFEIPPGDLRGALEAYAAQSGVQLVYKIDDVRGQSTKGIKGSASADEALQTLLESTTLKVRRDAAGAVVLYPGPAAAATPAVQQLDPIMVSANLRREPQRDVPMQVDVVSVQDLNRAGATQLSEWITREPGVAFEGNGGPGMGGLAIRGVTTGAQTVATVGAYVDNVAFGSSTAYAKGAGLFLDMGLLDLKNIEILRGPQGTLYGASAMGGLLKYVTNDPDPSGYSGNVSLNATATHNGGPGGGINGVVNVPLKEDEAALRLSGYWLRAGGFIDAIGAASGFNVNNGDSGGGRAAFLWTPDNRLSIKLTGMYQSIARNGTDFVDYNPATSQPVYGNLTRHIDLKEPYNVRSQLYSADVEYDYGWARLNSITSYQQLSNSAMLDAAPFVPLLGGAFATVGLQTPASFQRTSQEFRLTSKSDSRLEWLAGLYLDSEKGTNNQHAPTTFPGGAPGPSLADVSIPSTYKEIAGYGDVTYKFNPAFAVTGGLRYGYNKQTFEQNSSGLLVGGSTSVSGKSSEGTTTFLLTGLYAVDASNNVYGRIASGYRPGGPNAIVFGPDGQPLAPTTFASDTLTSYELGYKADLVNHTLGISAAIYDIEWKNLQQAFAVNGVSAIVNAGDARIQGAELTLNYRPTTQWLLSASAAWVNARFTQDAPGLGAVSGDRLPDTPPFSAALAATYNFALSGYPAYAGINYRYVGERNAGIAGNTVHLPSYVMPSYSLTDLQAGITVKQFNVALYLRNLFDERAQLSAVTAFLPLGGNALVSVAQPRTFGVTASMAF